MNGFDKRQVPLCAAAALTFCAGSALAQQVTLYGLIDTAIERVSNVGAGGSSVTRMPSATGTFPSRWGLRGSEDLGNGLKAVFTLESGFGPDTGTAGQGGRLFGRQANVGLSGAWGTVTFGRQYTMLFWSLLDSDVIGPMALSSGSLDAYIPNARIDNAIAYRGKFGDLSLGGTFSLGRDTANPTPNNPAGTNCGGEVAGDAKACREWSVLLKYDRPTWGLAAASDKIFGGAGSWAAAGLTSSSLSDQRTTLNGYFKLASLKIGGGVIRRDNEGSTTTRRSDLFYLGASYPLARAFTLDAEWLLLKYKRSDNKARMGILRGTYEFSKRTAVYAAIGRIVNDGTLNISVSGGAPGSNPIAGAAQNGVIAGIRHSF